MSLTINAATRLQAARGPGTLNLKVGGKGVAIKIDNFADYGEDGFAFTVATELEAFQAAYVYRRSRRVNVEPAFGPHGWLVQVSSN